jgi:hypothetical protein
MLGTGARIIHSPSEPSFFGRARARGRPSPTRRKPFFDLLASSSPPNTTAHPTTITAAAEEISSALLLLLLLGLVAVRLCVSLGKNSCPPHCTPHLPLPLTTTGRNSNSSRRRAGRGARGEANESGPPRGGLRARDRRGDDLCRVTTTAVVARRHTDGRSAHANNDDGSAGGESRFSLML